jgi:putative SOS response-associated peptidase YedK
MTVAQRFGVAMRTAESAAWSPHYNIAPTKTVIVVNDDGTRHLTQMRWGLIPSWAKDPAIGNRMINARAETVATKPAFRVALRKRRCLIPADGFYEWKPAGRRKQPVYITLKTREPFSFAGLWETLTSPDGEEIKSCTIVTTEANELLKPIHDRMPVILTREAEAVWLDPKTEDPARLLPLLTRYPFEAMEVCPVSLRVNNPANDGAECIEPLDQRGRQGGLRVTPAIADQPITGLA